MPSEGVRQSESVQHVRAPALRTLTNKANWVAVKQLVPARVVAVWNAAAVNILGAEFAFIVLILVPTMLIQSRKHDFI
jgi:hypothetical protein